MTAANETTLKEVGEMLTHVVAHMATKEDVAGVNDRLDKIEPRLASLESEVAAIRRALDDLREKVENVIGFRKEIDHALERVAAIEKHLGIDKKIAA
jgi:tetrahydromethanopterin S-methyltransferase subunit G